MAEQQDTQSPLRYKSKTVNTLILINGIAFVFTVLMANPQNESSLFNQLALFHPRSDNFRIFQLFTHIFLHGSFWHIFINMFVLWMFGSVLEGVWGPKKFLIYYFLTGLGAAGLHLATYTFTLNDLQQEVQTYAESPSYEEYVGFKEEYIDALPPRLSNKYDSLQQVWEDNQNASQYQEQSVAYVNEYYQRSLERPTVGASGAIYGLLLAFGMLFPNVLIFLFFLIPIKAKYFVILIGVIELYSGVFGQNVSIANFAHLGGMIFGFILLKIWGYKKRDVQPPGQADET